MSPIFCEGLPAHCYRGCSSNLDLLLLANNVPMCMYMYPKLNVILGHLGEGLPFWLDRIDLISVRDWKRSKIKIKKKPSEYIKKNFTILTSGMHFLPAFMCAYMALGADRIAFGTDYPYAGFKKAVDFVKEAPIPEEDKEKIFYSNAAKLFKM